MFLWSEDFRIWKVIVDEEKEIMPLTVCHRPDSEGNPTEFQQRKPLFLELLLYAWMSFSKKNNKSKRFVIL